MSEEEGEQYEFALDPDTDQELIEALEAAEFVELSSLLPLWTAEDDAWIPH